MLNIEKLAALFGGGIGERIEFTINSNQEIQLSSLFESIEQGSYFFYKKSRPEQIYFRFLYTPEEELEILEASDNIVTNSNLPVNTIRIYNLPDSDELIIRNNFTVSQEFVGIRFI